MNMLIAASPMQQSLAGLTGLTEIRDLEGRVLGYFSPAREERSAAYAKAAAHFDHEETKRRKQTRQKGLTTTEVMARLRALET
jgi:hypothetical protein